MSETPSLWERTYDRKGALALGAVGVIAAACGGNTSEKPSAGGTTTTGGGPREASGTLFYYNWAEYVNPQTYKDFTAETGVKVKKDFYASNEDLQAKLNAGARGYDLIVPTNYMVKILAGDGLLQEIDWSALPTVKRNIDPRFDDLTELEKKYSVPKDWGTTGYMYRKDLVKERPTTWREFYDLTKGPYSKKVTMIDGSPEVIGSTLTMLGHSYNSDDEGELNEAREQLLALKPHILAITSSPTQYRGMLTKGRSVMHLGWNGDAVFVSAKKPTEYVVAEEGGEFWVDSYAIPAGANNPDAAYAWMEFVYDPKINAQETEFTYYGPAVKKSLLRGELDSEVLNNHFVYPPDSLLENLEPNKVSPEGTRLRDRIWTEFKAA
jgi:spermidine/putrescine transport system substrate-binding protein